MSKLFPFFLFLSACALAPTRVGGLPHLRSSEAQTWIHIPGDPHHETYLTALRVWRESGLPEPSVRRVSLELTEGYACRSGWGCASPDRVHSGIQVSLLLPDEDAITRTVVHELMHVFAGQSGLGVDRGHDNPDVWRPHCDSVEWRACMELGVIGPQRCQ